MAKMPMKKGPDGKMVPAFAMDGEGANDLSKTKKMQGGKMVKKMKAGGGPLPPKKKGYANGKMVSDPEEMKKKKKKPKMKKKDRSRAMDAVTGTGPMATRRMGMKGGGMAKKGRAKGGKRGGKVRGAGIARKGVRPAKII